MMTLTRKNRMNPTRQMSWMNRVRKNYGGRMIFGDEKLTPLRSVPHCVLGRLAPSGRLTGGYQASGVAPPTPKFAPVGRKLQIPASRYTQFHSHLTPIYGRTQFMIVMNPPFEDVR